MNQLHGQIPAGAVRTPRVAYVLKRYPRFSETFVVNEILAHERAGLPLEIFSLRPTVDSHFQHAIADVRASVTHIRYGSLRGEALWEDLQKFSRRCPRLWDALAQCEGYDVSEIHQGLLVAREVEARGVTHLHAHFATSAAAVARLASLLTGATYSVTAHAKDIFDAANDERLLSRKFLDAKGVVTVSEFNLRDLRRRFPDSAANIRRIYNGICLRDYPFSRPASRAPSIVAVGRLVEKKGFDDLVRACRSLVDAGIRFECEIIGGGDREAALRTQIGELGLHRHVRLRGPLPHREAHRAVAEAAVCVAPCVTAASGDRDGLPTVLLEAMALGTPCVATDVTGVSEVVRPGETGVLVPERRPDLLAEAIRGLLGEESRGVALATAARRLIETQFDIDANSVEQRRMFGVDGGAGRHDVLAARRELETPALAEAS